MSQARLEITPPSSRPVLASSSTIAIPVNNVQTVEMRLAPMASRADLSPQRWRTHVMNVSGNAAAIDVNTLGLPDGEYEYEFVLNGSASQPVPDPYAEEIVRFGGYRGVLHIRQGKRWRSSFDWSNELDTEHPLPPNGALNIYELPVRWMTTESDALDRQVGLGTFDKIIFELLPSLSELGFNALELLPSQDSADTLNWGYGTRFFFAPDYDLGSPLDLKCLIKRCHQLGIRVLLDVVMNHARECPLERLAYENYFLKSPGEEGREFDWGGKCFRFVQQVPPGMHMAREFLYRMARYWVSEYRIDGFRIDEFKGINNYAFVQEFTEQATREQRELFPERPFLVVAEDSWRRTDIVKPTYNGKRVVDAMWDFNYRDEVRRLLTNQLSTNWGQPSRRERVAALVSGSQSWDDLKKQMTAGFSNPAQRVIYLTSHDVQKDEEQRILSYLLADELRRCGWLDVGWQNLRNVVDGAPGCSSAEAREALTRTMERVRSAFVLLTTAVGIPMVLAGDDFGDTHDVPHEGLNKMSDPVDLQRAERPLHAQLRRQVAELLQLRNTCPALRRAEVDNFYFHPDFDQDSNPGVFAYCRTAGNVLGSRDQIVVVANMSTRHYDEYFVPWHWSQAREHAISMRGSPVTLGTGRLNVPLLPFQARVFSV